MRKKTSKLILLFSVITICCIVAIVLFLLPARIGDIIYERSKSDCEVTAVQVVESSSTSAQIFTYFTDSTNDVESFLASLSEMDIKVFRFSLNARRVIEYVSTLYDITVYKADGEAMRLTVTSEGKLFTQHTVYSISEPQIIDSVMSQAKEWE